jgi:Tol biopolymer transport system component
MVALRNMLALPAALTTALTLLIAPSALGAPATQELISVNPAGLASDRNSEGAEISADGRFVVFVSHSTDLIAGEVPNPIDDVLGPWHVYVRDRQLGVTTRVDVRPDGSTSDESVAPSISGDGRYVAFTSGDPNLVAGDSNGKRDIFVRDMQTGTTTRASLNGDGEQGNNDSSQASISGDGRYVAFFSNASNLAPSDTNVQGDVFVRDRVAGTTTQVDVDSAGNPAVPSAGSGGFRPKISANGRFVVFTSNAPNLVPNDTNNFEDEFVHDLQTGATTRVSVASDGSQANNRPTGVHAISADGRFVAFGSDASNLTAAEDATPFARDVFVHDRQTGETTIVDVSSAGVQSNAGAIWLDRIGISADGRFVAFDSFAGNLVAGDTNGQADVFVRDRLNGVTTRVSVTGSGGETNSLSHSPSISGDGSVVAFNFFGDSLLPTDQNLYPDVYAYTFATDSSAPAITPHVSGPLGTGGWYTGDVGIGWTVSDPESPVGSTSGCGPATVTADTAGQTFTCQATSAGGTASQSVTVKRDATRPTVNIGGAGTYAVTGTVPVTCSATDATSGIASSTCAALAGSKPAWQFAAGTNALTATATDRAGNSKSVTANVVVTVSASSLCTLTTTFVQGSAKYKALPAILRAVTNALVTVVCNELDRLAGKLTAAQKAKAVAAYKTGLDPLVSGGWLTSDQRTTLRRWADAL